MAAKKTETDTQPVVHLRLSARAHERLNQLCTSSGLSQANVVSRVLESRLSSACLADSIEDDAVEAQNTAALLRGGG